MMDPTPVFSDIPHPTHSYKSYDFKRSISTRTRTSCPIKYFYIDFGLSWRLPAEDPSPRVGVDIGGDKSVPEYKDPQGLHDPYKIDVYCLGNIIREYFMDVSLTNAFEAPDIAHGRHYDSRRVTLSSFSGRSSLRWFNKTQPKDHRSTKPSSNLSSCVHPFRSGLCAHVWSIGMSWHWAECTAGVATPFAPLSGWRLESLHCPPPMHRAALASLLLCRCLLVFLHSHVDVHPLRRHSELHCGDEG